MKVDIKSEYVVLLRSISVTATPVATVLLLMTSARANRQDNTVAHVKLISSSPVCLVEFNGRHMTMDELSNQLRNVTAPTKRGELKIGKFVSYKCVASTIKLMQSAGISSL